MKTLTNDLINNSENIITFEKKLTWIQKGQWIVKEKIEKIKLWIIEKIFTNLIETKKWKKKKQLENANLFYDEKIKEIKEKIDNLKQDSFQQVKNSLIESNSEFTNIIEKEEILFNLKNKTEKLLNLIKETLYIVNKNLKYKYMNLSSNNVILSTISDNVTEITKEHMKYLNEELEIYQEDLKNLKIDFNQIEFKEIKALNYNLTDTNSNWFWSICSLISQLDNIKENIEIIEEDINNILKYVNKNLNFTQDKINKKIEKEKEEKLHSFYLTKFIESIWEKIEKIIHIWKDWKLISHLQETI